MPSHGRVSGIAAAALASSDTAWDRADLAVVDSLWRNSGSSLRWDCPFVLPPWLGAWWEVFGQGWEPLLRTVRHRDQLLGIAPLMRRGPTAWFLGSPDLCDYQDFVVAPGGERDFFSTLLDGLAGEGVETLDLGAFRADSATMNALCSIAREQGAEVFPATEDVTVEMALPSTWGALLARLGKRERHELRRKLRRLEQAGEVSFGRAAGASAQSGCLDTFLDLFRASRKDKAAFLTPEREAYFRVLAAALDAADLLALSFLRLDGRPVAAVFCLEYGGATYLYNNGYDPAFRDLSVGFLAKVESIRDSVSRGQRGYSFLKGAEPYKLQLGGRETPLLRARLALQA